MPAIEVRNWLGLYFLILTSAAGGYLLIFANTMLLPISRSDATAAFEIIVPVLVGQLTVIFRWFGNASALDQDRQIGIPSWIVKAPPIIVLALLVTGFAATAIGQGDPQGWNFSAESLKAVLAFCVSLLNATTIFVVSRYFENP